MKNNQKNITFILMIILIISLLNIIKSQEYLENKFNEIIVGPVIGKVTETSARVMIEFKYQGTVTMILKLTQEGNESFLKSIVNVVPNHPAIFKFDGLTPGIKYVISLIDINLKYEASFRTLAGRIDELNQ